MASRRFLHELSRRSTAVLFFNQTRSLASLPRSQLALTTGLFGSLTSARNLPTGIPWNALRPHPQFLPFSSNAEDSDDGGEESSEEEEEVDTMAVDLQRDYSPAEKEAEAAEIGYKVVGPLQSSDHVFKHYEPVFAIVQIGSHQFKVSNGDSIYTERLKFCEVNDKLILNKVLLLGSRNQTVVGRPILPDAAVHAVVEEHALDAKVLIFKKKRRKNYRRTKGHRQELTKLRITDIQGIEKPEAKSDRRPPKAAVTKQEKVEVAA